MNKKILDTEKWTKLLIQDFNSTEESPQYVDITGVFEKEYCNASEEGKDRVIRAMFDVEEMLSRKDKERVNRIGRKRYIKR